MKTQRTHMRRDLFYTFDIETTTLITGLTVDKRPIRNAIIWSGQFYDGKDYVQERSLQDVIRRLELIAYVNRDNPYKVAIFVHNLSYEFQFIKNFFNFEKILCTNDRSIISAETDQLVFRCSYMLSNMGLGEFLKNEQVPEEYQKTDMDYYQERYPWTPITDEEYTYCANDVIGLHKAITHRISQVHNMDINNLPLTSTGYVRKDCRKAMQGNQKNRYRFFNERLDRDTFLMNQAAFRGGNTHANKSYVNKVILDEALFNQNPSYYNKIYGEGQYVLSKGGTGSDDIRSSYPTEIVLRKYPTKFMNMKPFSQAEFDFYLKNWEDWAMLIEVSYHNLYLKDPVATPVPYLSISKCNPIKFFTHMENKKSVTDPGQNDNGRIIRCEYCKMTLTEIDYMILRQQYNFDEEHISRVKVSKKKYLSKDLIEQVMRYFYNKTTLKQDEDDPNFDPDKKYLYDRSKALLNGIYGMHVTSPCRPDYVFNENSKIIERRIYYHIEDDPESGELTPDELTEMLLDEYYESYSSFLSYQVGIWVTAYARLHLQMAIDVLGNKHNGGKTSDLIYCDTDSVKFMNPADHIADIEAINKEYIRLANKRKAYVDWMGERVYMGVYEAEKTSKKFKTFGAKKYIYGDDNDFKITISGVNKKNGHKCIMDSINEGKMQDPFQIKKGYVFKAIKKTHEYQDHTELHELKIGERSVFYASNIAMYNSSYTLGLTNDFELLLEIYQDIMED